MLIYSKVVLNEQFMVPTHDPGLEQTKRVGEVIKDGTALWRQGCNWWVVKKEKGFSTHYPDQVQ